VVRRAYVFGAGREWIRGLRSRSCRAAAQWAVVSGGRVCMGLQAKVRFEALMIALDGTCNMRKTGRTFGVVVLVI